MEGMQEEPMTTTATETATVIEQLSLTSTTAPGAVFASREELALHYRSDWHRYNLKRRQAGMPPVTLEEFRARLAAAQQLKVENNHHRQQKQGQMMAHWKDTEKNRKRQDRNRRRNPSDGAGERSTFVGVSGAVTSSSQASLYERIKEEQQRQIKEHERKLAASPEEGTATSSQNEGAVAFAVEDSLVRELPSPRGEGGVEEKDVVEEEKEIEESQDEDGARIEIDPRRCLFDRRVFPSVEENVSYMNSLYGFFVPDADHLVDLSGLVGYCHEKIQLGMTCLWCQHAFGSPRACVDHMKDKGHTKIRYESGIDLDEFDVFYDFDDANQEYLSGLDKSRGRFGQSRNSGDHAADEGGEAEHDIADDDDAWEDITDDEGDARQVGGSENMDLDTDDDGEEEEDDDNYYQGYEEEVRRMGLSVSDLGELVFPDGRTVGHRGLRRYYKQRLAPSRRRELALMSSEALRSARIAAGERVWKGRVHNIRAAGASSSSLVAAAVARQKLQAASLGMSNATGRAGSGILVLSSASPYEYSRLSIYRYRAAVRKAKYGENYGRRLRQRTSTNLNRMDKKANRLANGVSVAHAAR